MKKKILSLLIAAVLLLSLVPLVGASSTGGESFILASDTNDNAISQTPKLAAGKYFTGLVGFKNVTTSSVTVTSIEMITDTSLSVFPFEVVQLNYFAAPKDKNGNDLGGGTVSPGGFCYYKMDNLRCRGDATEGYYNIPFEITLSTGDKQTLSLPILITAAETTPEGSEVPTIIITGFYTSPSEIIAGEALTLFVTFKNTSSSTAVSHLKAQLTSDGTFTPINGSSTLFADNLGPNASTTMSIHLDTKAEAAPGSYSIGFNISYSYPGATTLATDNETISVPVTQVPKIKVTAIQTSSTEVFLGQEVNIMSQINNTGKGTIYNVTVKFADTNGIFTESESYLGNIAPGSTGNIDVYL
ncbi:MAG: hypothetical protein GX683_01990, partial [Ruminococcaceae bacterium]|nr:hypothetical protein [Oscillospiraceae bacterium]